MVRLRVSFRFTVLLLLLVEVGIESESIESFMHLMGQQMDGKQRGNNRTFETARAIGVFALVEELCILIGSY